MPYLFNRSIILVLASQGFSGLGSGMFDLALVWWVLDGGDNPALAGIVLFFRFLPFVLFGLVGGWVGDRWDRRGIVLVSDLGRAGFLGLAVIAFATIGDASNQVMILAAIGFILGLARVFFQPAIAAMIPDLCAYEHLPRVNALFHGWRECIAVIAPLLGGLLLAFFSQTQFLMLLAGLFVLGGFTIWLVPKQAVSAKETIPLFKDYRGLIRTLKDQQPALLWAMILSALMVFSVGGVLSLALPALMAENFPDAPNRLGLIMGSLSGGTLAASACLTALNRLNNLKWMYLGWALFGALITGLALPLDLSGLILVAFLLGAVGAAPDIMLATLIQQSVPRDQLAKSFALFSCAANSSESLSAPSIGLLISLIGLPLSFVLFGGMTVIIALFGLSRKDR